VRSLLAIVLALVGFWLLLRRRHEAERVLVAWGDGSELALDPASPDRRRLVAVAREALR
jgi:hypothetical protein